MPLVSQGGGRVKTAPLTSYTPGHAPTSLGIRRPRAGGFLGRAGRGIQKTTSSVPSGISKASRSVSGPTKATGPNVPGATGGGGAQDPFEFIKGLLSNMDPVKARALVDQIYAPLRQQINDQIAQSQGLALARAQQMQQVYGAFAQYMGGLSGNLQSIYQAGRSDGNALASGMAGPGGAVADHLNTMAGIQNTMLDAEAKGWGGFGASMPGVYSLMATQNIKNMLNAATADQATLRNKLLELSSQEASDILKYLDDANSKDAQLKEWAWGQQQTMSNAKASQNQAYLNYLQRQGELKWQHDYALSKLTLAQQTQKMNQWYKTQLINARNQGLIDERTYRAAMQTIAQQNANTAQTNAATSQARARTAQQQADTAAGRLRLSQAQAQKRHVKVDPNISRSTGWITGVDPSTGKTVRITDANGNWIKWKEKPGASTAPGAGPANRPGTKAFIYALKKERTSKMTDMGNTRDQLAKKYYVHTKGYTDTTLTPQQKAQIKAQIWNTYEGDLLRIARNLLKYGQADPKYTPRNLAEYWLNQAVGW